MTTRRAKEPLGPGHMRLGACGSIASASRPIRRFYRRNEVPVEVDVMRFSGLGVHYYASVKSHPNPVRGEKDEKGEWVWYQYPDDVRGRSREYRKKFDTAGEAERFVRDTLRKHFKEQPFTRAAHVGRQRWYYRDGD